MSRIRLLVQAFIRGRNESPLSEERPILIHNLFNKREILAWEEKMKELSRFWVLIGTLKEPEGVGLGATPRGVKGYLLRDFDLSGWLKVYGMPVDGPPETAYYHDIDERHVDFLRRYINEDLDLEHYDYYIELQADYGWETKSKFENE